MTNKNLQFVNALLLGTFAVSGLFFFFMSGIRELSTALTSGIGFGDAIELGIVPLFGAVLSMIMLLFAFKSSKDNKSLRISSWINIIAICLFWLLNGLSWIPCMLKNNCSGWESIGTLIAIMLATGLIFISFIFFLVGENK